LLNARSALVTALEEAVEWHGRNILFLGEHPEKARAFMAFILAAQALGRHPEERETRAKAVALAYVKASVEIFGRGQAIMSRVHADTAD
jgi:hypothetical protein